MAKAEIVSIGSELLLGQIVDSNAAWMAQRLTDLGVDLYYKTMVGDNEGRMADVIDRALGRSDVVITGGGLGPTQDDITRQVIAEVTGRKLVLDPELLAQIEQRFRRRGFIMTANNERQAYIPEGAIPVKNPNGTAPSFIVEDPRGAVFALPGVPFEMKWLFDNEVAPYLRRSFSLSEVITYQVLKVSDLGESAVDDLIGPLIAGSSNPTVGVLAHPGQVDVRIAAKAGSTEEARKLIAPVAEEIRSMLGRHVFAEDEETMEQVVGRLLREKDATVAVYEDTTSGLVAERVQEASFEHFLEGVIGNGVGSIRRLLAGAHSPDGVEQLLGEPEGLVGELAAAVRSRTGASYGLAVHGVPEPGDMSQNLARGKTYMSVTNGERAIARSYNFAGRGRPDRTRMSIYAIDVLRLALQQDTGTDPTS